MKDETDKPPLSRVFAVSELRDTGRNIVVTARPAELAALAQLNGLVSVVSLEAQFRVAKRERKGLAVQGELRAKVVQTCVVTLEPFPVEIVEGIDVRYEPQGAPPAPDAGFASLAESDPPDPIVDGKVDLGALAGEYLALGLDPYPRKPGASLPPEFAAQAPAVPSPFAGLKEVLATKGDKM